MNTRKSITLKLFISLFFALSLTSCVSMISESVMTVSEGITRKQEAIITAALKACKMNYSDKLTFDNREFYNDCSGLIYGIFWESGIDLVSVISKESGNGVKRLYSSMSKKNLIHTNKLPNPGDLIFWNNTYGSWGKKPLSHIGIVVSVKKDGSIEYVHNNTYLGEIRKESMNLYRPHDNRPINNYMRYDAKYKKTAAELFDSFGMAWKL